MKKMLEGIKVVDCTLAAAGPACTKILTDYGTDTILVEPITGTSIRSDSPHTFDYKTGGKKSVAVNLKTPEGIAFMYQLIDQADIFVSNYRKQALERLGLGYETLKKRNPRLIYATLNGYGNRGPKKADPGFDVTCFWAHGGMMADISNKDAAIINMPIAIGDVSSGQGLAVGVCAALYYREKTGKGMNLTTSLLGQAVWLNFDALIESQYGETYPKSRKAPISAVLNTYPCKDGKWIALNAQYHWESSWPCICKLIGRPELIEKYPDKESVMYEHAPKVVRILEEGFQKLTREEVMEALNACEAIAAAPVLHSEELLNDPQILANEMLVESDVCSPKGAWIKIPVTPLRFEDEHPAQYRRGPKLGEHAEEILKSLGYSDEQIKDLIDRGIFVVPQKR